MTIIFKNVTAKNFFSVGDNPIKIQLNRSPSTLVRGQNGASKSSLFADAIYFALFKKSFRGLTLDKMVNNINNKGCLVTVEFNIGENEYIVSRGLKPNVFTVLKNGKPLDELSGVKDFQEYLENHILGFDANSFIKTCVISSMNYKPFMKLSGPERRTLTDTLLSTSVFTEMSKIHKQNHKDITVSIKDKQTDYSKEEIKRDMLKKQLVSLQESDESKKEELKEELKRLSDVYKELHAEIQTIQFNQEEYDSKKAHLGKLEKYKWEWQNQINELNSLKKPIFQSEKKCSECGTMIAAENAQEHYDKELEKYHTKIVELGTSQRELKNVEIEIETTKEEIKTFDSVLTEINQKNQELSFKKREIISLKERYNKLSTSSENVDSVKQEIVDVSNKMTEVEKQLTQLEHEKEIADLVADALKDTGIKSRVIGYYIPLLCDRVNHYLSVMNFNLLFRMDSEFNETLVTRFSDEFTYENLSGGEKQRLDLALIFAWRDIAKMKGSVDTNFLLIDELLDHALDAEGTEDVMSILADVCRDQNVFLISHKNNLEDKVFSVIEIYKENGFARIK